MTSCTPLVAYLITTDEFNNTKTNLTYLYVGTGMSIGTGEAEANSRPGSSPDDDGEDKLPEAIYRRERDMENSPSEPATLSGDFISPVVEPEKEAASSAEPHAEPGANTGRHPQQQQD